MGLILCQKEPKYLQNSSLLQLEQMLLYSIHASTFLTFVYIKLAQKLLHVLR